MIKILGKLLLYLLLFTMLLGEKKLFYNPDSVILYDITSSKIEIIKKKQLDISSEVDLKKIIKKRKIVFIGNYREVVIKYAEYDENKKVYNVYYEVGFVTPQSQFSLTKIVIMGVYDENFNYLAIEEYPLYRYAGEEKLLEEITTMYENGEVLFFKFYNDKDVKSQKYVINGKEIYLIRNLKNGDLFFNDESIKKIFRPGLMNEKKTFLLGTSAIIDTVKNNKLYRYDFKTGKLEMLKEFSNIGVILQTLIENDNKLIYWELDSKYSKEERKLFIFDLKSKKTKELKLSDEVFEEFYYSHEIRNVNKKLIEKFSESM